MNVTGIPYQEWAIDNLPASDPRVTEARNTLVALERHEAGLPWDERILIMAARRFGDLAPIVFGYSTGALVYDPPNFLEVPIRAKVSTAHYELVRLRLAQRLAELETGAVAPIGPEAIKLYVGTIPNDPFSISSAPMLFSSTHGQFYSVGPDEDDDGMKMLYDASNGTLSNGDIFMKP